MLQWDEKKEAEESNDVADVNTESNKIDEDKNGMIISMEEEQKTLEYQETMKVDVENIAKNKTINWRPKYEVIDTSFFVETKNVHENF